MGLGIGLRGGFDFKYEAEGEGSRELHKSREDEAHYCEFGESHDEEDSEEDRWRGIGEQPNEGKDPNETEDEGFDCYEIGYLV